MTNYDKFVAEQMKDPKIKAEYDALEPWLNEQLTTYGREPLAEKKRRLPRLNVRVADKIPQITTP
ncbi:MAG: hypothetical protein LBN97_03640 [Oscillospiraceae bacterium]|jgi:hypothetical protein|nr:hypothetical protein [Oscillospiraceae bacterium]